MITKTHIILRVMSIAAIIFIFCLDAPAQVTQEWVKRYNGTGNGGDHPTAFTLDNSGNIYVSGYSKSSNTGNDFCTIKYNQSGTQQWILKYNGPADSTDAAFSIVVDNSGNVYVTGHSYGFSLTADICTIKYNSYGLVDWIQRYNGPGDSEDVAVSCVIDTTGNAYAGGYSVGSGTGYDYCLIKYNASGVQQWVKRYNGPGNSDDRIGKIVADKSGNIIVTGISTGIGTNYDYCTVKYNSSGTQQWVQRYNGPANFRDMAFSLITDSSGNIFVTGGSEGTGTWEDFCTIKYNAAGVQQWIKRYNSPVNSSDLGESIAIDNSGNVYVTGYSSGSGTNQDFCTIKYSSSGTQQWVKTFNGNGNSVDYSKSIFVDDFANVYITGSSTGIGTGSDFCTVKYNTSGVQQWVQRYNGPGNSVDESRSIIVNNSGYIYVIGSSVGTSSSYDYCTIKYYDPIGIQKISNEIPKEYVLYQNYPNPFNPKTKIKFDIRPPLYPILAKEGKAIAEVVIKVFDILGREVTTLVNEQLNTGSYEIDFDGTIYTSGVYFYELSIGDYRETKQMVLIK